MKVAVFSDCYLPAINGVVTSIVQQVEILRQMGHEVDLFCPDYDNIPNEEISVFRLWARPFAFHKREQMTLPWPPSVVKKLWTTPYDLFHLQTPFSVGLLGLFVAAIRRIPRVFHHHTLWEEYVDYLPLPKGVTSRGSILLCRSFANSCQAVITPSEQVRERFSAQGVKTPIRVIPTGIRASIFQNGTPRPELAEGEEVCLYVGRVAHEKSIDVILKAFSRIAKARPTARLWIVGDGPARESLEQLARTLEIDKVTRFFGFVDRTTLCDFVASARVFLFASLTETQGLVLLEAQAGGLPVVSVAASGVNEAVDPGKTGFLVKEGQIAEMADLALCLLKRDRLRREMSEAAVEWSSKFSIQSMGDALIDTYCQALKRA